MNTCGRCGWQERAPHVRSTIANLEREARQDGTRYAGTPFAIEDRCKDKDACRARVASQREGR
jgi:hypothetical protein